MRMRYKIHPSHVLEYLVIFCMILSVQPMYGVVDSLYNIGITAYTFRVATMLCACVLIIWYALNGKLRFTQRQFLILVLLIAYLVIYLAITRINVPQALEGLCVPIILFYLICCMNGAKNSWDRYFSIFENIVVVLAAISLVFYFGGVVFNIIPGLSMQYYNNGWWYSGTNYFYLHFVNNWQTQTIFGTTFVRNIGIFMEAPSFSYVLLIAFWSTLFKHRTIRKRRVILLTVTLITTFSTKGLILGALLFFAFMYSRASDKARFWRRVRWILLPIIALTIGGFVIYVLATKVLQSADEMGSWAIRLSDVYAAFTTWLDFPLFGCGFLNLDEDVYKRQGKECVAQRPPTSDFFGGGVPFS